MPPINHSSTSVSSSSAAQAAAMVNSFSNMGLTIPVTSVESYQNIGNMISSAASDAWSAIRAADPIFDSAFSQLQTSSRKASGSVRAGGGSGSGSGSPVVTPAAVNYVDAPLAQQYGMNAATAYQEALANTAHQREMLDLQRAGLNPVLAARYSGAGVFSPDSPATASSGGSGGRRGSGSSAKSSNALLEAIPALLGAVVTIASGKPAIGSAASSASKALIPLLTGSK